MRFEGTSSTPFVWQIRDADHRGLWRRPVHRAHRDDDLGALGGRRSKSQIYGVQVSAMTLPASTRSFGELSLSSSVPVSSSFFPTCGFSASALAINR